MENKIRNGMKMLDCFREMYKLLSPLRTLNSIEKKNENFKYSSFLEQRWFSLQRKFGNPFAKRQFRKLFGTFMVKILFGSDKTSTKKYKVRTYT